MLPPNLVTLLRLPLGLAFVWVSQRFWPAIIILIAAGVTDILDGFLARRSGRPTPLGAVLDGILDKALAALVIGSLLWHGHFTIIEACLLGARELLELPLVVGWSLHPARRQARADHPRANWLGKLATVIQFAAIVAALAGSPLKGSLVWVTAFAGTAAAISYWRRESRRICGHRDLGAQAAAIPIRTGRSSIRYGARPRR